MPKLSAAEAREKWQRRLSGAVTDIQRGVAAVTEAPSAKAVAKKDKLLQNVTAAIQSGKWERSISRVSLEDWKRAMLEKGVGRISSGVQGAGTKMEAFYSELFPYIESLQNKIKQMPDLTLADSVARAQAWIEGMARFRRGGR
jgi:hypothetical protein